MKPAGPPTYLLLLVSFFGIMAEGRAEEWIHLDRLDWELTSKFDGTREKSGETTAHDIEMESGVRLRQSGYGLDPRIFTFSVEAYPVFSQGRFRSSAPGLDEDRDVVFLNFNGSMSVFRGAEVPVSFDAQASRNTGSLGTSLGSRSDFTTDNRYVGVNWKTRYFPTTFSYSERHIDQTFRSGLSGAFTRRDDTLRTVRVKGRSSKMDLQAEHSWFTDNVGEDDRDYTEDRASVANYFRWGKGSRFNSRIDYFDRRGFLSTDRLSVTEDAHLQHTKNLSTSYVYRFQALTVDTETTSHDGTFGLTHELYKNLTTNLTVLASADDFTVGTEDQYRGELHFAYRKKIFWGGRVSAGVGGGYGIVDRRSTDGMLQVRDESHVVDASLVVLLVQRFIDTSTIVVTDATGTFVFTEGVDYSVVAASNDQTELHIIPGGAINISDTILVSYQYQSLPSVKFSTIPFRFNGDLDFGWIRLFHRTTGEKQDLVSGDEEALTQTRNSVSGIEFKWRPRDGEVRVGAEKRFYRSGDLEVDTIAFTQSVFYALFPNARLSLNASESFIDSGTSKTDLFTADASLSWRPLPRLSVTPSLGTWMRTEDREAGERTEERFLRGALEVEWSFYKVDVRFRYTHDQRRGTITPRDEDRVLLTIVRRSK